MFKYDIFSVIEILVGIVLLTGVFILASNIDMRETRNHLAGTINYIKEQYNQHKRLNLASETKSVMRVIESTQHIENRLKKQYRKDKSFTPDQAFLEKCARDDYVSGILLLDQYGNMLQHYCKNGLTLEEVRGYINPDTMLDTIKYPEKTYALRVDRPDESYVDIAALGISGQKQILITYYYTPIEYIRAFSNSVEALLTGYSLERDGTIVISNGKDIIASNNESLIGKSTDDIAILKKIRERAQSRKLVHTNRKPHSLAQNFGLMEHGRDYYVYAYMPESDVFNSTFQNVLYSMIVYVIILIVVNMVRWKTAHTYQEKQAQIQEEYTRRLQTKNDQLIKALEEADRANVAKTSFLSRMSHDIRTPLNGIIGLLEIGENHPDDMALLLENQKKMKVSANHLLSLINDVLQMSKLESSEIEFSHEKVQLAELSHEVLMIVEQRAADAGITLEYDRDGERSSLKNVYGSPLHLRQIFLNIYGNCIKYNKVGGRVHTICTCLKTTDHTVTYRWVIEDTGIGMSKEFLEHIFEPFAQENIDARSVYNGTGLGMSIVKRLVDKMQGTIEVQSERGVGSVFTITLPFEIAEDPDIPAPEEKPSETVSLEGLHVLLVEDNSLNAEIAQTLLADRGINVTLAENGREAIDTFRENEPGTFDMILMDIMMPVVDGLSATKAIRAMERADAAQIPIIAMTANAFDEDVRQCLDAGMNAHLAKPLQMDQVIEVINRYSRPHM